MVNSKLMMNAGFYDLHSYKHVVGKSHLAHPTGKTLAKDNKANIQFWSCWRSESGLNVQSYAQMS
jgi:hypothetical protein